MLTTSFYLAKRAGACKTSYRKFAKHVGGIRKYGRHTPIPLTEILDVLGLIDVIWCLGIGAAPSEQMEKANIIYDAFNTLSVEQGYMSQESWIEWGTNQLRKLLEGEGNG